MRHLVRVYHRRTGAFIEQWELPTEAAALGSAQRYAALHVRRDVFIVPADACLRTGPDRAV